VKITNFGSVPTGVGGAAGTGGAVGGDLAGTTPAPTVVGIQGVPVDPTPPTPGQELGAGQRGSGTRGPQGPR